MYRNTGDYVRIMKRNIKGMRHIKGDSHSRPVLNRLSKHHLRV